MSANKRPRKAYKPRPASPHAHVLAIRGATWVDHEHLSARRKVVSDCVDAACQGRATVSDWKVIFDCINTLDVLVRMKIATGAGVLPAMEAMEAVMDRAKDTGSHALRHEERQVIRDVGRIYMECIEQLTCKQLHDAETTVGRVVRGALSASKVVDAEDMGCAVTK